MKVTRDTVYHIIALMITHVCECYVCGSTNKCPARLDGCKIRKYTGYLYLLDENREEARKIWGHKSRSEY